MVATNSASGDAGKRRQNHHLSSLVPRSLAAVPPPLPPLPPLADAGRPVPRPLLFRCVNRHLLRAASFSEKSIDAQITYISIDGNQISA